ncbi:LamG domain-containing protein, partial [bacterium]|nr:LamG domain-containing protein [bacterium]
MLRNWLLLVFMTGLACLCSVDAAEADKDLLVHYTFEEGDKEARPNGKVHDHSGRKNHGTLYGARYVKMREGYALAFAGGKGFAKCTGHRSVNLGTSDFTVEFWMKLDSFSPGMIMAKKGETPEARGWHMAYDNARKQIPFQASDGQRQEDVSAPLADLDWHQVVVVRRRKTLTLCLDGEAAATKTRDLFGSGFSNDNVYLFLGRAIGNEFTTFHGKLDEVLIRKSALTVEEIASRYQIAEKNRPMSLLQHRLGTGGGLVLHYTFNQDHRGLAKDHSVFGHDGEIVKAQYVEELDG